MKYLRRFNEDMKWDDKEDMLRKYPELTEDDVENPLTVDMEDIYQTLCISKTPSDATFGKGAITVKFTDNKLFGEVAKKILMGNIVSYNGLCECYRDHWGKVTVVEVNDVTPFDVTPFGGKFDFYKEVSVKTLDGKKHPIDMHDPIKIYTNKEKVRALLFKYVESIKNQGKFDL